MFERISLQSTPAPAAIVSVLLAVLLSGLSAFSCTDDQSEADATPLTIEEAARRSSLVGAARLMVISPVLEDATGARYQVARAQLAMPNFRGSKDYQQPLVRLPVGGTLPFGESYLLFLSLLPADSVQYEGSIVWSVVDAWELRNADGVVTAVHPSHGEREVSGLLDEVAPLLVAAPTPTPAPPGDGGAGGVGVSDLYWRSDPWVSARNSELLVEATVLSVSEPRWSSPDATRWSPGSTSRDTIYRLARVRVDATHKGEPPPEFDVVLLGGTIDDYSITYDEVTPIPGGQLLLFLRRWAERDPEGLRPYWRINDYYYIDGSTAIAEQYPNQPLAEVIADALAEGPRPTPTRSP